MRPFRYAAGASLDEVLAAMAEGDGVLAGGTDLLPLLKADVRQLSGLVDIKEAPLSAAVQAVDGGTRIGALATIATIAESPLLAGPYSLLRQAARDTATAQLRNRATLGGNLLQRPRCWYYRNAHSDCWLKGGEGCPAVEGRHEHHAIFEDGPCRAAHPSDLASCLLALDASVVLHGPGGERRVPLSEFYRAPAGERRAETVLGRDEIVTAVDVPEVPEGARSIYLKAMDRKTWAFALVGIGIVMNRSANTIGSVRIVATAVAPVPRRLVYSERALTGTEGSDAAIGAAIDALGRDAQPLVGNVYKLELARRLLGAGLRTLLAQDAAGRNPGPLLD